MKLFLLVAILLISIGFNTSKRMKRYSCKPFYNWRRGTYIYPSFCPNGREPFYGKFDPVQEEVDRWEKIGQIELEKKQRKRVELAANRKKNVEELERKRKKREEETKKKSDSRKVLRKVSCWKACSKSDPSGNHQRTDKYGVRYVSNKTKQLRCYMKRNSKITWNPDYCLINKSKFNKTCWAAERKVSPWDRRNNLSCNEDIRLLNSNKAVFKYVK